MKKVYVFAIAFLLTLFLFGNVSASTLFSDNFNDHFNYFNSDGASFYDELTANGWTAVDSTSSYIDLYLDNSGSNNYLFIMV